jgi:hypothetical protein
LLTPKSLDFNFWMKSKIYLAGSSIDFKLTIDNKTKKEPKNCTLSLIQHVQLYVNNSKKGKNKIKNKKLQRMYWEK